MSTFVLCVGCGAPLYGFSPCQWCTCERCGNDLRDGFCSLCNSRNSCVYDPNLNSFDCPFDSFHPPHPTYESYSGDSCGNDSHFGYDCPPQFPLNYEPELGYIQNYNSYPYNSPSFPQQYLCCDNCGGLHETFQYEVITSSVEDLVLILSEFEGIPDTMCDVHLVNNPTPLEAKDHFEIVINSNDDYSSSNDDSLYNENIEYVEASPHDSELVSLEVAEIVIPEDEEIEDDNLHEKLLNISLLIAKIEALKDNPTLSFEFLTKSSSTSPKSFLEETNTFYNSLPEFESFCFDLEEISSGSTTTHSDISLLNYEAFYFDDDHIKEISSGRTTTHLIFLFLNMIRLSLIFQMISFLLPIGVTLLMRSSPMNSLTSYLHQSMMVSTLGIYPIRVS
nr:pre-mRNA splicing Prp18-interacting factor [Tanacetum cinerariifolium]